MLFANTDVLDLTVALTDEEFVPKDYRQREHVEAYARRFLNNWIAIEEAHDNGIASEAFYSTAKDEVRTVIRKRPGIVPIFERITTEFDLSSSEILEPLFTEIQERRIRKRMINKQFISVSTIYFLLRNVRIQIRALRSESSISD